MEVRDGTCLVVAWAVAIHHDFHLQGAVEAGFLVHINIDDVASLTHDTCRTGQLAESITHAGIIAPPHLLVVAVNIVVITNAEELLEAFARIACRTGEALPSVVLHLEYHCLHVVIEGGKVEISSQCFVAEGLNLVLEDRAGFVLEEVCEGCLVGVEVALQLVVGIELCPTFFDECLVQLHFLEAPDTIGCATAPSYHDIAAVAMQTDIPVVEDVVGQVRSIVSPFD